MTEEANRDDNWIDLHRLVFGHHDHDRYAPIYPVIPTDTIPGEDKDTKRICTAPTLDDCLTALGPSAIGIKAIQAYMRAFPGKHLDSSLITFPFTDFRFSMRYDDPDLVFPNRQLVPDVYKTDEVWITKPVAPDFCDHLWLVDGKISFSTITWGGEDFLYTTITDSKWSYTEQCPAEKFYKDIIMQSFNWLVRDWNNRHGSETYSIEDLISHVQSKPRPEKSCAMHPDCWPQQER